MAAGSGTGIVWSPHPNVIRARIKGTESRFFSRLARLSNTIAARGESLAKTSAPWTDRTGAARNGIRGTADTNAAAGGFGTQIVLSYNVDYGIWLELANQGRYATVIPTLQVMVGEMANGLKGLL